MVQLCFVPVLVLYRRNVGINRNCTQACIGNGLCEWKTACRTHHISTQKLKTKNETNFEFL